MRVVSPNKTETYRIYDPAANSSQHIIAVQTYQEVIPIKRREVY